MVGAPIGEGSGFAFSDVLSKKGGTWDWDNLSQWLTSPRAFAPGTKMSFAGLSNPQDRADVMAFLNAHSVAQAASQSAGGNPAPTPSNPPGTGPNNGPQKAENEPVLSQQQAAGHSKKTGGRPPKAVKRNGPAERSAGARRAFTPAGPAGLALRRRVLGVEIVDKIPRFLRVLVQWMRSRSCGAITPSSTIASKLTTRFQ